MKKSIKLISLLLVLVMAFSVIACQRPADKQEAPKTEEKKEEAATTTADGDVIEVKIGHTDSSQRSTHKWAVWLGEYLEERHRANLKLKFIRTDNLETLRTLLQELNLAHYKLTLTCHQL